MANISPILIYLVVGIIVSFVVIKEICSYRLPASHWFNQTFNPPPKKSGGRAIYSDTDLGGHDYGGGDFGGGDGGGGD